MVAMPDQTAERRFIVTGDRYEGEVVVDSGLEAGENIITDGMQKVRHGQKIRTISAEEYAQHKAEEKAALEEEAAANASKKKSSSK